MSNQILYCNFCGKSQHSVAIMIAATGVSAFICNECVDICNEIIFEDAHKPKVDNIWRYV